MRAFYSDHHKLPLPSKHRFPVDKYRLLRERIIHEGIVRTEDVVASPAATDEQILRVHSREYLQSLIEGTIDSKDMGRIGFPWSPELVVRSRHSTGATIAAAEVARTERLGINLAGGTHHSFADRGEGYCVFNDVACAIRDQQSRFGHGSYLIIDCDVHQGNGSAVIFADDPHVYTFSIHGAKNFPLRKEVSDLDIALPDGTTDLEYLEQLSDGLVRAFADAQPDFIFYLAGADPFMNDRFGKMKITKPGLQRRDELVLTECARRELPVVIAMSGGYSPDLNDIVDIQSTTISTAVELLK